MFWQYKLGNGLNERAADDELDMFASRGGGVLELNLYGDVPTKKKIFTLLQNFCLQMIPCSRKNR